MKTSPVLVATALVCMTALSECRGGSDPMILVGEIYYPVFANPATARILVRVPTSSISAAELGVEFDLPLTARPGITDSPELEVASKGAAGQFRTRVQILGFSEDGSEAWVRIPAGVCTSSERLQYEPGKTTLVNVLMKEESDGRLVATSCEPRTVIQREPIRTK